MTIGENIKEFAGQPVHDYSENEGVPRQPVAPRLSLDWDSETDGFEALFGKFLEDPNSADVEALVIGNWGGAGEGDGSEAAVEALVSARDSLPKLKALFLGEMTYEESEISWIQQSDISPIFEAFPKLEVLYVRGGNGLSLGRPRHAHLKTLVIQSGGLPATVVREVTSAELPSLEHLELWLGDDGYGNNVSTDDIINLITKGPIGKLQYLGLRDDCEADATAAVLAQQEMPSTLEVLDLSLGTLGDEGANALADAKWLSSLKKLDIHHHYVSPETVAKLKGLVAEVDHSEDQEPDEYDGEQNRYVAVSE